MEMDRVKRRLIITYSPIGPAGRRAARGDQPHMSLEDELLKQRLERIREIEALGYRAYGRRYDFTHTAPQILAEYGGKTAEELLLSVEKAAKQSKKTFYTQESREAKIERIKEETARRRREKEEKLRLSANQRSKASTAYRTNSSTSKNTPNTPGPSSVSF